MSQSKNKSWYHRYELLAVLACVAVFAGLVLLSINRSSIWHDEGYTAVLIENSYPGIIERTAMDVHPPFYYLALKTWSLIFGDNIMTLRLFSAVCMLAAMLVTWRLIRRLYGTKAGLVALGAMAIGPFLVRYGQEMRMYGLAALLASLATYLYVRLSMTTHFRAGWWAVYGLLVLAGVYTQYFFVLVPAVHFVHFLFIQSEGQWSGRLKQLKGFLLAGTVIVLGFAAWLPTVQKQFSEVQGSFWIPKVSVETLTSTPIAMTVYRKQFQMTGFWALPAVLVLLLVIVLICQLARRRSDKASRLLVLSVILPPALLFLLSLPPFQPSYQDRYMSFMAPIFYSALGIGVLYFAKRWQRITMAVVLITTLLGYGQVSNYRDGNNHGWEPAPYFTMNSIIDQIDTDHPIYATSLWTFFDAYKTTLDRQMPNRTQVLLGSYPDRWMGNWSAIYERPDLIATTIPFNVNKLWLIDESGRAQYYGNELDNFRAGATYTSGYAKITEYIRD